MELHTMSAIELGAAIARREVSPLEVTEAALERAAEIGPQVGAFAHLTPDYALRQAQAATDWLAGRDAADVPPLFGVPCPIKDLSSVAGLPLEAGSRALAGNVTNLDDGIVTKLRAAGTIMLGKTTTPEFGFPPYTEPDTGPAARTPWDLTRSAGGSSGGAGACVAAGIAPVAQGSDSGGSIRIPAAACGLVGLKPSRGRISWGPHRIDGSGLGTDGVLTRTVRDTAIALDILAGPGVGDTFSVPPPADTFLAACDRLPRGLRVGVLTEPVITTDAVVHPEALAAVAGVAPVLEALGCVVEQAPVPFPAERWLAFQAVWSVSALGLPLPPDAEDLLVPLTRWLRVEGRRVSGVEYATALAEIQMVTREAATAWAPFDVILSPTLAQPPAPVGSIRNDADPVADFAAQMRFTPWTSVANLTGRPAISLPVHRADIDGVELPFGVMLTGAVGAEELLLGLSAAIEAATPWPHPTGIRNS